MAGVTDPDSHAMEEISVKSSSESGPKRRRPERTPHQIARKRDQDREAQRQSRERTRRRIEEAETRLAESHAATAKYKCDFQQVVEERDTARNEASNFKEQLESVCSQLEAARTRLSSLVNLLNTNNIHPETLGSTSFGLPSVPVLASQPFQLQSPQASEISVPGPCSTRTDRLSIRNITHHSSSSPTLSSTLETRSGSGVLQSGIPSSRSSPSYVTEESSYGSPGRANLWHDLSTLLPKSSLPTCPLDNILQIFSNSRRELLRKGATEDEVLGPRNPSLSVLPLLGNCPQGSVKYPLSHMLSEVISKIHLSRPIPEQVAVLWMCHLSLRWNILPSRANWEALPEYVRPVHSQVVIAHPVWQDHLPWPGMRSILAERSAEFTQNEFYLPFWEGLSVNWPYDAWDAIIKDETTGEVVISPAFEEHIRILENWSLGPEFARAFPSLNGTYSCHR